MMPVLKKKKKISPRFLHSFCIQQLVPKQILAIESPTKTIDTNNPALLLKLILTSLVFLRNRIKGKSKKQLITFSPY